MPTTTKPLASCGHGPTYARGLCRACYSRALYAEHKAARIEAETLRDQPEEARAVEPDAPELRWFDDADPKAMDRWRRVVAAHWNVLCCNCRQRIIRDEDWSCCTEHGLPRHHWCAS